MISRPLLILLCGSTLAGPVVAGSLDAPAAPDNAASAMYTLGDLYKRINTGAAGPTPAGGFTKPAAGPAPTGYTLTELYNLASQRARPAKTGQTTCYDTDGIVIACTETGQDGELQKGVTLPSPRFTDNNNGTVTDNLTGLIWLKNASCFGSRTWAQALTDAKLMSSSSCGLSDGSMRGHWRLPSVSELSSLIDRSRSYLALSNGHPFTNVSSAGNYWSSTTYAGSTGDAWYVDLNAGDVNTLGKTGPASVWPVRGGL